MQEKKPVDVFWGMIFRKRKPADVSRNQFLKTIPFFENLTEKQMKTLSVHEFENGETCFSFHIA